MRKINKILIGLILIAIMFLGIGYSAIQNITLEIKGTVTADLTRVIKPSEIFDASGDNEDGLHIGDFVNYDAGTWTASEISAIQTGLKTDLKTANGSVDLPTGKFQFGGFTAGSSRNGNATPYDSSYNYVKDTSTGEGVTGWRVFDIDGDNVTLISAGNPEDYYHPNGTKYGYASEYILTGNVNSSWSESEAENYQKRDWGVYVNTNQKATSATPITKARLDSWYTKYTDTANADTWDDATFQKIYSEPYIKYQNIVENYSYYWLSAALGSNRVYGVDPNARYVFGRNLAFGVRVLVSLSSDVLFTAEKTGTKTITGGNMDTYGGEQTYNCWEIATGTTTVMPYLPIGFSEEEGTSLDTGYTIQDSTGNQYVWVEVPQTEEVYPTAGLDITAFTEDEYTAIENDLYTYTSVYRKGTSYTDTYYSDAQTGLTSTQYTELKQKMLKSVYQNGGFYVGKYEAGIEDAPKTSGSSSTAPTETAVIKQNAYPYNYVTCSQAQTLASGMESGEYTSSLMFGVQWDLILKYMETKAVEQGTDQSTIQSALNSDSTSWGNYKNNLWNITNASSKYAVNGSNWTSGAYGEKTADSSILLSTGASDTFSKQGIYDLAGNVWEWTLEYTSSTSIPCAGRGGVYVSYGYGGPASNRFSDGTTVYYDGVGFRVALY